jgi:hypothetical protein
MLGERPAIEFVRTIPADDPVVWGLPVVWGKQVLILIRMHNISGAQDWTKFTATTDPYAASRLATMADGPGQGTMGIFSESVIAYREGWPEDWENSADATQWIPSIPGTHL